MSMMSARVAAAGCAPGSPPLPQGQRIVSALIVVDVTGIHLSVVVPSALQLEPDVLLAAGRSAGV